MIRGKLDDRQIRQRHDVAEGDHVHDTFPEYSRPTLFQVGAAKTMIRGYSYGKYSDGYTGYYWER